MALQEPVGGVLVCGTPVHAQENSRKKKQKTFLNVMCADACVGICRRAAAWTQALTQEDLS